MIKGVNLGNWLVLEKWMSPDLFEGSTAEDKTTLREQLGLETKLERIRRHRSGYITERDLAYLSSLGIEAVRIRAPYFMFGDAEPFVGCVEYLDKAFEWASAHGLKIILDLHTVPGSQNGFDNGGCQGERCRRSSRCGVDHPSGSRRACRPRYSRRHGRHGVRAPVRLAFRVTAGAVRPSGEFRCAPLGSGTQVVFSRDADLRGIKRLLMAKAVQGSMDGEMAALDKAKAVIESVQRTDRT